MALNVRTSIEARVNLIYSAQEMQEMTALAHRFGLRLELVADPERKSGWIARLSDGEDNYAPNSIAALVLLRAICSGTSIETVLSDAKRDLMQLNVNVETIGTAICASPETATV